MGDLNYFKEKFKSVGWFVPPYVSIGFLSDITLEISNANGSYTQDKLEVMLSWIYSPEHLASMTLNRYPEVPYIKNYSETISEAIIAHFSLTSLRSEVVLMNRRGGPLSRNMHF